MVQTPSSLSRSPDDLPPADDNSASVAGLADTDPEDVDARTSAEQGVTAVSQRDGDVDLPSPEGSAAMMTAPGMESRDYVAPLADAYRRLDPTEDGWQSEAFNDAAGRTLSELTKALAHAKATEFASYDSDRWKHLLAESFECCQLHAYQSTVVFQDKTIQIRRTPVDKPAPVGLRGPNGFQQALMGLVNIFKAGTLDHVKFKLYQIDPTPEGVSTKIIFQASGPVAGGSNEINAIWRVLWTGDARAPKLARIEVESCEEARYRGSDTFMFADCTQSVMADTDAYRNQFLYSTDYWRSRVPSNLGLDVVANHGMAMGDVNGDGLEDLYICQQGGLPNRLLIQNPDGTLHDATRESGADWLDYCSSALLVDFDNDGDRDLAVVEQFTLIVMSNDGSGRFWTKARIDRQAQCYSLTAADYDNDGDVDIYSCGYNPSASDIRRGAMGEPMPFHDANNGGPNVLLRNDGDFKFTDVTVESGLDVNNRRYSFAAAWEDYDNDGDVDLYVANDYGRNNLYRNDAGTFTDLAAEFKVEDVSAGMSVNWSDFDRDGWMDVYISNMFSSAGNRITYQRQFQSDASEDVRHQFQRLAHGNTLYRNTGDGRFNDVTDEANVWMGRWSWGSRFADLNADGWDDLVVANGFITTDDTGDL